MELPTSQRLREGVIMLIRDLPVEEEGDGDVVLKFELGSGIFLKVYDFERIGDEIIVNLAPPSFEQATLSGCEPESYVDLAATILAYALSDDSGDWGGEEDVEQQIDAVERAIDLLPPLT
jgi:hypothetical protein